MTHVVQKIFGTDGIRGKFGTFPITVEFFEKIGQAISDYLGHQNVSGKIFIGNDTRASADALKNALFHGLGGSFEIYDLGVLPTPAIAFLTAHCGAICGISITASHNSYGDNGIKIFNERGRKLSRAEEEQLEYIIFNEADHMPIDMPTIHKASDKFLAAYQRHWEKTFATNCLNGLSIVFDAANGATAAYGSVLLGQLGARVFAIGNAPTGYNINGNFGTEHQQVLQRVVTETGAHIGIAVDGDGDRVVLCDREGKIFTGEHILAILAINLQKQRRLESNCLVTTVACNTAVDTALKKYEIRVHRCDVGDRNVAEAMAHMQSNLGGEPSGHVICTDFSPTADGLFTAVAFIRSIIDDWDFRISSLRDYFPLNPCVALNLPVLAKIPIEEIPILQSAIADVKNELAKIGIGRVLVRHSGTENILRILVEADTSMRVQTLIKRIAGAIQS
ncbi:MAG: hypothetical protein LBI34_00275 [Puniceicoccales bacterium]|jgi:phosphoglucosamine mutase|nr:hypothetical protein [Puniceicoccales bacterium]